MDICRNPMVAHRMLGVSTKFPSGHSNTIGAGNLTSESWVPNFFKLPSRNSCSDGFAPWKLRFRFKWVAWGYAKQLPLRYHWRACRSRLKSWIYYMICWNTSRDETLFLLKKCHWALDQLPRPSWNMQADLLMSSDLHFLGLLWNPYVFNHEVLGSCSEKCTCPSSHGTWAEHRRSTSGGDRCSRCTVAVSQLRRGLRSFLESTCVLWWPTRGVDMGYRPYPLCQTIHMIPYVYDILYI